jgi:transcriptional repressor NrdR
VYCPFCNHDDSKVVDSRDSGDGIRRRRQCLRCDRRFTTYERVHAREVLVQKRDGRSEEFSRDKLWSSLTKACAKRPMVPGAIDRLVDEIEAAVIESGKPEIPARAVGDLVMDKLRDLDRVAYIRYASVYRDFRDIEAFKDEINALLAPPKPAAEPSSQLSFLEDEAIAPHPLRRRGRPRRSPKPGS